VAHRFGPQANTRVGGLDEQSIRRVDESEDIVSEDAAARLDEGRSRSRLAGSGRSDQSDASAVQLHSAGVQADYASQSEDEPENWPVQIHSGVFDCQPIGPVREDFRTRFVEIEAGAIAILKVESLF